MPPRTPASRLRHRPWNPARVATLVAALCLLASPSPATEGPIWLTTFDADPSQPPNGFRYNTDTYGQDVVVNFDHDFDYPELVQWVELQVNGVVRGTCSTGSLNCEFIVTETCSKLSLRLHAYVRSDPACGHRHPGRWVRLRRRTGAAPALRPVPAQDLRVGW